MYKLSYFQTKCIVLLQARINVPAPSVRRIQRGIAASTYAADSSIQVWLFMIPIPCMHVSVFPFMMYRQLYWTKQTRHILGCGGGLKGTGQISQQDWVNL